MNAVDTNILVYAVSADEAIKGPIAMDLLDRLSATDTVLLWQVACEFSAVLARLRVQGRAGQDAFEAVTACRSRFPLVMPSPAVLDLGLQIHCNQGLSYWDAMLLAACVDAEINRLYTEDIQSQPRIRGVEIVNPFLSTTP